MRKYLLRIAFISIFSLLAGLLAAPAQAQDSNSILHLELLIVGPKLTVIQDTLALPRNIPTVLNTEIALPTEEIDKAAFVAQYLPGTLVEAELRGPAYTTPIKLHCAPNGALSIPPIPVAGMYLLENIRLTRDGETLFGAEPGTVPIEVIDEILISKVTSRPLTLDEIRELGIVLSPDSFEAYEFTAVFALQAGEPIEIRIPVLRSGLELVDGGGSGDSPDLPGWRK